MKNKKALQIRTDLPPRDIQSVARRGYVRSPTGGFLRDTLPQIPLSPDKPKLNKPPQMIAHRGFSRSPTGGFFRDQGDAEGVPEYHERYWKAQQELLEEHTKAMKGEKSSEECHRESPASNKSTPANRYIAHTGYTRTPYGGFYSPTHGSFSS